MRRVLRAFGRHSLAFLVITNIIIVPLAWGQDPGEPDEVVVGNLDGSPILSHLGCAVNIPVWVNNDEDVANIQIPLSTDDEFVTARLGGNFFYPLIDWYWHWFSGETWDPDHPFYTCGDLYGISFGDLNLNTGGDYRKIGEFSVQITSNSWQIGQATQLIEGNCNDIDTVTLFGLDDGITTWPVAFIGGELEIIPAEPGQRDTILIC